MEKKKNLWTNKVFNTTLVPDIKESNDFKMREEENSSQK